jgi:hypothetical protein
MSHPALIRRGYAPNLCGAGRGRKSEVRCQRAEARGQRSEIRGQRSEVRCQKPEVRGKGSWEKSNIKNQKAKKYVKNRGWLKIPGL